MNLTKLFSFLIFLFLSISLFSQYYTYKLFNSKDGFPNDEVAGLLQTRDGYLWTVSGGKLLRFDGIKANAIESSIEIRKTYQGIHMIELENGNLMFNGDAFHVYDRKKDDFNSFYSNKQGIQIFRKDDYGNMIPDMIPDISKSFSNDGATFLKNESGYSSGIDNSGDSLFLYKDGIEIDLLNDTTFLAKKFQQKLGEIPGMLHRKHDFSDVFNDNLGRNCIGDSTFVFIYDQNEFSYLNLNKKGIYKLYVDSISKSNWFVSYRRLKTKDGSYKHTDGFYRHTESKGIVDSLKIDDVLGIEFRNGSMYYRIMRNDNEKDGSIGIWKYTNGRKEKILEGDLRVIGQTQDNKIIVARDYKTDCIYILDENDQYQFYGFGTCEINNVIGDMEGNIWLATTIGLMRFSPSNLQFVSPYSLGVTHEEFVPLGFDHEGQLWFMGQKPNVSSFELGIYQFNPSSNSISEFVEVDDSNLDAKEESKKLYTIFSELTPMGEFTILKNNRYLSVYKNQTIHVLKSIDNLRTVGIQSDKGIIYASGRHWYELDISNDEFKMNQIKEFERSYTQGSSFLLVKSGYSCFDKLFKLNLEKSQKELAKKDTTGEEINSFKSTSDISYKYDSLFDNDTMVLEIVHGAKEDVQILNVPLKSLKPFFDDCDNLISRLSYDKQGILWITAPNKIIAYRLTSSEVYSYPIPKSKTIRANKTEGDPNSGVWYFSDDGLFHLDIIKDSIIVTNVGEKTGIKMSGQNGTKIIEPYLFMYSLNGMYALNIDTFYFKKEFLTEKIEYVAGSSILNIYKVQKSGNEIQMHTEDGIIRVKNIHSSLPPIQFFTISSVDAYDRNEDSSFELTGSENSVGHNENDITFHFKAVYLSDPQSITYQYKLAGYDENWKKTKSEVVSFTSLNPGTYDFIVKACSGDGNCSDEQRCVITINPPFYSTWWFISLCILAGTGVLYLIYKSRVSALKARQEQLESEIKVATTELREQKEEIEESHREIKESITYARRIQEAILPPTKLVKEYLTESFILYKPKDIVAGDFYWFDVQGDDIYFAAADCTGHGVPGAMVSVVCANALNRTVNELKLTEPAKILDKVRDLVVETFEKSEEEVKDGMDISFCKLNLKTRKLTYSGAHNPLYRITLKTGEIGEKTLVNESHMLVEYKGDKQPIGKFAHASAFTQQEIQLLEGDSIYLSSDGYPDQFGGEKGKKYLYKRFKQFFLSIHTESLDKQKELLNEEFNSWKANQEQVDDVCVIGVRV